ncbi:fluoride efflux transporter CrcB [Balneatrix alpica]|uniref:Fluoride-specific ion channel FluC n=1 Tax=Balneatrix alpica TaxID=75684 RepID=A0ABV5Z7B3_9GAMM|nr:fluoride efflux transporter CrcB [Balneatrix alpica]
MIWLMIAGGGALGALLRYGVSSYFALHWRHWLPWGTLLLNLSGSLLIGIAYVLIVERGLLPASLRPLLMTGFLGALTTYSTFALEAVALFEQHLPLQALLYMGASVFGSVLAAALGVGLTRFILS